jgi:acyl-coenzyme A thioesterase PaaI-like protein
VILTDAIKAAKAGGDYSQIAAAIPYMRFLGVTARQDGLGLTCVLPAAPRFVGNPLLPAFHGGVVAGLMEATAILELLASIELDRVPKLINIAVDYLRPARVAETFAQATVTREGRRVADVGVEAWQDDRARPVAAARVHFLLV